MKTNGENSTSEEMLEEYDFSNAEVGKYAERYAQGTNVVLLDADVVGAFPDSKSVNEALRSLLRERNTPDRERSSK